MDYLELHTEEVGIAQLSRMTWYTEYYVTLGEGVGHNTHAILRRN